MSQAGSLGSSSSPSNPTTFIGDTGSATPAANILNLVGGDTASNDDDGIRTSASGNTVTVQLTNRSTGSVSTNDDTPTTALSLSLGGTPGVYFIEGSITAFNQTDSAGGVYSFTSGIRTTGVAATEIGTEFKDSFEEAAMSASDFTVVANGNDAEIMVSGIAGKTIDWNVLLTYRFVS